jgi:hypothetical protein
MYPEPPAADVRVVAEAIRRYLMENPHASDTAQGIGRWWLLSSSGEFPVQTVEAALAQLEGEGSVRRIENAWAPAAWVRAEGTGG